MIYTKDMLEKEKVYSNKLEKLNEAWAAGLDEDKKFVFWPEKFV